MENRILIAVSQSPIFKNVEILDLQELLGSFIPTIKEYKKNEIIKAQGTKLEELIIVLDGKLKARMDSADGKSIGMEEFSPYMSVAISILFSPKKILPVTLFTVENSEIFCMSIDSIIKCGMQNRQIFQNILCNMSERVSFLSNKIKFLQLSTIRQKIAHLLIKQSKEANNLNFTLKASKEDIAREMGVARPSLSREFIALALEGIITQNKKHIKIIDMSKLEQFL